MTFMPATRTPKKWSTLQLAKRVARLAEEKLAEKIVVIDVGQAIQVADYFVVCEGKNRRHLGVVAEHVAAELKKDGFHRIGGDTAGDENWVLLDFGPVVLHVMSPRGRAFYDLENLWGDCPRRRWRSAVRKPKASGKPETAAPTEV
jgi:ribosome-associated protein